MRIMSYVIYMKKIQTFWKDQETPYQKIKKKKKPSTQIIKYGVCKEELKQKFTNQ